MRVLRHVVEIAAPRRGVWAVLTDFERYRDWNPFIVRAAGRLELGSALDVTFAPVGGRAMRFQPVIVRLEPERQLAWAAQLLVPGLFDGEHAFRLADTPAGGTRLEQVATFHGVAVPLLPWKTGPGLRDGFGAMVRALRERAEAACVD